MVDNETLDFSEVDFPEDCIPELESHWAPRSIDGVKCIDTVIEDVINRGVPYVKYDYLWHITNGFHSNMKIGTGGFSEVFKGLTKRSNIPLTIKKLDFGREKAYKLMNFEGKIYDGKYVLFSFTCVKLCVFYG